MRVSLSSFFATTPSHLEALEDHEDLSSECFVRFAIFVVKSTVRYRLVLVVMGLLSVAAPVRPQSPPVASSWPQWGGVHRNFVVADPGLAEKWPEAGPRVLWTRPLGTGHSAIAVDAGRLFTMYRVGNARAKLGPWDPEEVVVALDAKTGNTIWEHKYPSRRQDFSFGAGPHSTPLVVGTRVFTIGTNQELFAFDAATGKVLWAHDFIKEFNSPELFVRPNVKTGYACSPIAFRDTIICSVGGPGQSVMAFRQSDGAVVWKSGDFLTSAAAPILIELAGRPQLVFLGGGTVTGLDPSDGRILWSHPHDPGNDLNCTTPLWGADGTLVVSSAYRSGSRAIRLRSERQTTEVEELWFTNRVRFMFLSAIRVGDFVYGTTGDFGPAFLTALDIKTGQAAWQHRGFGRASLVQAGDKTIIMDEDGDLALARLTPQGATILSQTKIFDTTTWTAPSLSGTTLYARDREKIVAIDLGAGPGSAASPVAAAPPPAPARAAAIVPIASPPLPPALFAGTWRLDVAASRMTDGAGLAGLIAAGAPPTLHVTHAANGTLVVESSINEGHTRIYKPDRQTSTPVAQGGTIAMTTKWSGAALVAEGTITFANAAPVAVKESYTINAARTALSIDVTTTASGSEARVSRLVYAPISDLGPCEKWTTPCKR
jgi:outer membrane protein assembly factor BamB